MASYSGTMRNLGIVHIAFGIILLAFGIAELVTIRVSFFFPFTSNVYFGIWIGLWMSITGGLGIAASRNERAPGGKCFIGTFMFFAIISLLLGFTIAGIYGFFLSLIWAVAALIPAPFAIFCIILILGVIEFVIGLWAAICCCLSCCASTPLEPVMYNTNPGSIIVQGQPGGSLAVPVQGMADVVTIQPNTPIFQPNTSGIFGGDSQMVQMAETIPGFST